jgi:prepilin-type N-terminal cleavage/methylation domain-containing protein
MHQPLVTQATQASRLRPAILAHRGFSMIELMVVVGVIGVAAAMTVLIMPSALQAAKADGGLTRVVSALRTVREQAISQRRNIRVTFNAPNQVVVSREEVPVPPATAITTTVIDTVLLEDGVSFRLFDGLPDTPDAFGNATVASFGGATFVRFTSEGAFVDQNGDPANGTVFLGRYTDPMSARAVTIFGPTALIRQWRWNGRQWTN